MITEGRKLLGSLEGAIAQAGVDASAQAPGFQESVAAGDWASAFHSFTLFHLITVGACAIITGVLIALGLRWRGTPRERKLRLGVVWSTFLWQSWAVVYYLTPPNLKPEESLPLHVCDVAAWIAPLALLLQKRWLRIVLYYWGIGLSTQAFVTPVVQDGYGAWKFWLFWVGHTQIVGSACYDILVLRFRPSWRDFWIGVLITLLYTIGLMLPFNTITGFNYAYVGNTRPDRPTIIDKLGPWPLRVVWMSAIVFVLFLLITLVWPLARWVGLISDEHPDSATESRPDDAGRAAPAA
ncbi:MAG: TIGR02206 family membrane protein [Planctomycetota bacterium]|nr:TIGR02206 family membrane protein [Planctomycetota bacterium]